MGERKKWREREEKKGRKARKTGVSEPQEIHCVPREDEMKTKTKGYAVRQGISVKCKEERHNEEETRAGGS